MPSTSRVSIAWKSPEPELPELGSLKIICACDLRSNVIWITIAHRSNCIRDHWVSFILDHRSISWTNSIIWDHWSRWIISIWTTGPSAEPRADGSTMSATPGITPATFEPSLGVELLNDETGHQEEVHTLTIAKGQHPQASLCKRIPATG